MHLVFVPAIHTVDDKGNSINKLSCRDFWRGKNTYRNLQDTFFNHVKSKGFDLERGLASEITGAKNLPMEVLKQVTNYDQTQKILKETTLEIPKTADLEEFNKVIFKRNERIQKEIIKPRDKAIMKLHSENVKLQAQLSKTANIIDKATKFEREYTSIITNNQEMQKKCDNMEKEFDKKVEQVEDKYNVKAGNLQIQFDTQIGKMKSDYDSKLYEAEQKVKKKYNELENENRFLHKVINTLQKTVDKIFGWVSHTLSSKDKEEIKLGFEYDTGRHLDPYDQIEKEDKEQEYEMGM